MLPAALSKGPGLVEMRLLGCCAQISSATGGGHAACFSHEFCLSLSLAQPLHHWDHQPACEDDPKPWPPSQLQVGILESFGLEKTFKIIKPNR